MVKLICAPMATLSHEAFRCIVEKFGGCDEYYTEMINAGTVLTRGPFEKYYLMAGPAPEKIVWQLTGSKAAFMAQAASLVAPLGGIGVDLNMGCSAPDIYRTGAGISWMLKSREETKAMVCGVKDALEQSTHNGSAPMRLSVKLRLGDEDFTDDGFFSFCDMLVSCGVTRLTLHPRTKKEKYRRKPRWEYVERLVQRYKGKDISIVLNGDVKDCGSLHDALEAAPGADGVMIARAAAQKPWIFAELRSALDGTSDEKQIPDGAVPQIDLFQTGLDYIDGLEKYQPPEFWKTRMQRFFTYYCSNFSFAHYAQTQMLNATSLDDARNRLADYFQKESGDRYLSAPFLKSTDA